mgnify:CR=1 FL=1
MNQQNSPTRKSSRDLSAFADAARAAAEADGVKPQSINLPKFSAASPENIAQAISSPLVVSDLPRTPSSDNVIGEVFVVSTDLIDPNPQNSREGYLEDEIVTMMSELGRAGKQLQPVTLERSGDRYLCLDGYTRVQALRQMNKTTVDAIIIDPISPWERYKWSFRVNNVNRHTTDFDNGVRWRELIDNGITSQQQISAELGLNHSISMVSRVMSVTKFPKSIIDLIAQNKTRLSYSFYYPAYSAFADLQEKGDERAEEKIFTFLKGVLDGDISYRDALERLAVITSGSSNAGEAGDAEIDKTTTASAKPSVSPLLISGKKVGAIKEWNSGKIVLTLASLPESGRQEVKAAVDEILKRYAS